MRSHSLSPGAHGDAEVLALLERRRTAGRGAGAHADDHRLALVVGGGGMRGAYAGGMVHALEAAGLAGCFDEVWGSSAGAFVGTALVLGHGADASRIFCDDMASREFIDPRRCGTRRPMVSLDHLLDHILVESKPTDWSSLVTSPVPLHVLVTRASDLSAHVLTGLPDGHAWKSAMRATAAIPLLAGPPVRIGDDDWIDGSVSDPLPVARALRGGATHVLALMTRTVDELVATPADARAPLWARSLDRLAPGLGRMAQDASRHGECLSLLTDAAHPDRAGAHLLTLAPHTSAGVRGLTTDPGRVAAASRIGHETVDGALGLPAAA
ncbi:patatin [Pseudonocardia sp. EC080610-09]|uniref:patatin-like phospholipase family protein n=1 Tax=unclassified Pseudonocardia TaxID=2619320 RepID=UPI0006CB04C2|nr:MULTISPECIES: patatin-like phospholipase family protein [unclassified Pseudonocardia]ALE72130.1 patatin [Pseudonocardia sp. EC080625-04]ALL75417.1 patatin [Pseudonocardia sp. EC080610-09]ALL82443.1 patatin [Pseudonocardia sp. EC080619-01]